MLSGAMISLWVGRWRSQVPSVNSPECVEGTFYEVPGLESRDSKNEPRCLASLSPTKGRTQRGQHHGSKE
jgi:hypothetical protein